MNDIGIRYSFTLEDGSQEVFELTLDVGTLELKNATLHMLERSDIEGREASEIAQDLVSAFETFCGQLA